MRKILDVTDKRTRALQQGLAAACGFLAALGVPILAMGSAPTLLALALILSSVGILIVLASIKQRWEVAYRGHVIRFENSPLAAEKLFLDEGLVARGGIGKMMELRAPIRVGEGVGEEIVALVNADPWRFRLRLFVDSDNADLTGGATLLTPTPAVATRDYAGAVIDLQPVSRSAVLGNLILAKDIFEIIGAVVGLIGGLSAAAVWLF